MDWLKLFDEEGVQFVILDRDGDGDLVALLCSRTEWVADFDDGEAVIFARAVPSNNEDAGTSDAAQLTAQ